MQMIFLDLRCTGKSDRTGCETVTLEGLADDLNAAREALNLEKVGLIGWGASVAVALECARKYPDATSRLIVIGWGPRYAQDDFVRIDEYWEVNASPERKVLLERNLDDLERTNLDTMSSTEAFIHQYVADAPKTFYDPTFDCTDQLKDAAINVDFLNHLISITYTGYDGTGSLSEIVCPVFLALGRYDFGHPPLLWEGEFTKIPDNTYVLFEKSGHWPQLEEQELFSTVLLEWLGCHTQY